MSRRQSQRAAGRGDLSDGDRGRSWRRLLLCAALFAGTPLATAAADDWQVSRSEFDPRLLGPLKAELRRRPEDLGLLRRLMGLYRKHSSLDKLSAELLAQAEQSRSGSDYLLASQLERERGRLDEAVRLLEKSVGRPGGPEATQAALALAELALRRTPPDLQGARQRLEAAQAGLPVGDGRRLQLVRKLAGLYQQAGEAAAAAAALSELLPSAKGHEAVSLRRELADAQSKAGQVAAALGSWRELASGPHALPTAEQRAEAELHVGELCETSRDDQAALGAYRRGIGLLPGQHHLRRELYDHLVALHRKRDELPQLLAQLEKEWPAASRSFADWELLGRLYDERGDAATATAAYRAALRREPHSIDARRRLIAILERGGLSAEVLREYEQLIAQAPGDSRAYLELAERLERSAQRPAALAWLRRAAVRFAGDPSLHSALAEIYQRWGEAELALSEAELLVRLDPRDESYVVNLGELYWARGRKDRADEVWRRLLNLAPSRALGQARLADVYAEHSMMAQALELYQKAVKAEPNNLQLLRGLALATERLERPGEAVRHWEHIYFAAKAATERPLRLEARQHLTKLVRSESRLLVFAYSWQRRLKAQLGGAGSDRLESSELVALALLTADVALQLGQTTEAEAQLRELLRRLPDGPLLAEVLLALAPIYQQQRKLDDAIAALKRAAVLLPDRRRELYALLAELSLQGSHDEDAVHYAEQAVVDAQGALRLAEIFERRDDGTAAAAAYRRAIELDPRMFRAQLGLARLHLSRGELAQAATIYREVVQKAPQDELVLEAGRKAIDLHEYLGTLGGLLHELLPLGYAPLPKPAYRRLLVMLYERCAAPLSALARAGDATAQAELGRLGQSSFKPLAETLADGDSNEQRVAVGLLSTLSTPGAAPALLNLVGLPTAAAPGAKGAPGVEAGVLGGRAATRTVDVDLRVDALLAAARLEDPRSVPTLTLLSQSRETQLRVGALYGLVRLVDRIDKPAPLVQLFEGALGDARPQVRALGWLGLGVAAAHSGALSPHQRALLQSLFEKRRLQPAEVDELVAAAAVQALGRARDRSAVSLLIELLREGNDEVQRQAAWALGAIGDERAQASLLRAVYVKSEPVRQAAAQALGELRSGQAARSAKSPLPRIALERRGPDGLDVARLLSDSARYGAPGASLPSWLAAPDPAQLVAALDESLLLQRDIALRTLADLLGSGGLGAQAAPWVPGLGPLGEPLAALPAGERQRLLDALAAGLLPTLRRLAQGTLGGGAGVEEAVREQALAVLGGLASAGPPSLKQAAQAALCAVAASPAPAGVALRAAELLASHVAELGEAERAQLNPKPLDRLLVSGQRWARLGALEIAARPGGALLVSPAQLKRAASDGDGYIREAAERALSQQKQ